MPPPPASRPPPLQRRQSASVSADGPCDALRRKATCRPESPGFFLRKPPAQACGPGKHLQEWGWGWGWGRRRLGGSAKASELRLCHLSWSLGSGLTLLRDVTDVGDVSSNGGLLGYILRAGRRGRRLLLLLTPCVKPVEDLKGNSRERGENSF